jgi:hypothetical protein
LHRLYSLIFLLLFTLSQPLLANVNERHRPFILATTLAGTPERLVDPIAQRLNSEGWQVLGRYTPYPGAIILGITNDTLRQAAAQTPFGGYAAVQRVSLTATQGNQVEISYTNPIYMAHAYRLATDLAPLRNQLAQILGADREFGAGEGLTERKLRRYHYMFGMEYFDDHERHLLATHPSHDIAIATLEENLAKKNAGVSRLWRVEIPGKHEVLYGVALQQDRRGANDKYMSDAYIMGIIDLGQPRATPHLPYEILVSGNRIFALYGRFRIAVNFPELTMMGQHSFMNIVESPEAIKRALTHAAGGHYHEFSLH